MAKTLLLMRHAKSDRSQSDLGDFDRPLNKRGRRDAPLMAARLRDLGLIPDLALVSASARSCETWELMAEIFGAGAPPHEYQRSLYLARPQMILDAIHEAPDTATRLLVLAHNPGTELAAALFASAHQDPAGSAALAAIKDKFPTAAIAHIEFADGPWADVRFAGGLVRAFLKPGGDLD